MFHFFDKLEDRVRALLSHYPIFYSLIAGFAIVLFWWSVSKIADIFNFSPLLALIGSVLILLVTGLFTSFFVGDVILISGLKREKKLIEKTEEELDIDTGAIKRLQSEVSKIESILAEIRSEISGLKKIVEDGQNKENK